MSTPRHVKLALESEGWPAIADVINSIEGDAIDDLRAGGADPERITRLTLSITVVEGIRNRIRAMAKEAGVAQDPFRSTNG